MAKRKFDSIPDSWKLCEWDTAAPHVFPNSTKAATYLVRRHKAELIKCGAIFRIGRCIGMNGMGYGLFLARQSTGVEHYPIAANRHRLSAPSTDGGGAAEASVPS